MAKRELTLLLVLIFITGLLVLWTVIKSEKWTISKGKLTFSETAVTFSISGETKVFPEFIREVIVDPFKVKEGEKQTFSIWVKDPKGVEKLIGKIKTDTKEEIIEFNLVEGTVKEGRWLGSWATKDILTQSSYSTVFQAKNKDDKETEIPLYWYVEK